MSKTNNNLLVYKDDEKVVVIDTKKPFIRRVGNFRLYNAIELENDSNDAVWIETTRGKHLGKKFDFNKLDTKTKKAIKLALH